MKNKATIITTIIILAVATVGLTVSTVLLAINGGSQAEQIEQLTAQVQEYKEKAEKSEERTELVGMAACLMEGYELTMDVRNASCKLIVNFIQDEKTNADLKELVGW